MRIRSKTELAHRVSAHTLLDGPRRWALVPGVRYPSRPMRIDEEICCRHVVQEAPDARLWITGQEAAALYGLTVDSMRQYVYRKGVQKVSYKGRSYYSRVELDAWRAPASSGKGVHSTRAGARDSGEYEEGETN